MRLWRSTFASAFLFLLLAVAADPAEEKRTIVSHIRREPVISSGIASIGYSKRLHALEIEFVNGAIYRYLDVPASLHRQLMSAKSRALYYDENIRGKYRSVHVRIRRKR